MGRILLKNGIVVSGNSTKNLDVFIENGKIKKVSNNISINKKDTLSTETIDCSGKYVFPGFIDGHTHFDLSVAGTTTIDNFVSGTKAAITGGTTTIIDYGTQYHGESLREAFNNWILKAKNGVSCDYGIHMSISDMNDCVRDEIKDMIKLGITSFKLYTTYDIKLSDDEILDAMTEIAKCGGIVCAHCENDGIIMKLQSAVKRPDAIKVRTHALTRPPVAEADCINRLSYMSSISKAPFLAVHVTCEEALNEVKMAKVKGYTVFGETCPQYLYFDDSVYNSDFIEASKYVCSPPIRKKKDQKALWSAINDGIIGIISTDHCSFTTKQKALGKNDFRKIPGGVNLVEYRGILLFDAAMHSKITLNKMCELLSENPSKLFGLWDRKGYIKEGYDADLVIINPKKTTTLSFDSQVSKSDYCLFEGKKLKGKIEKVFLRGTEIVDEDKNIIENKGRFLKRKKFIAI